MLNPFTKDSNGGIISDWLTSQKNDRALFILFLIEMLFQEKESTLFGRDLRPIGTCRSGSAGVLPKPEYHYR
jgi:hypothetical protein